MKEKYSPEAVPSVEKNNKGFADAIIKQRKKLELFEAKTTAGEWVQEATLRSNKIIEEAITKSE